MNRNKNNKKGRQAQLVQVAQRTVNSTITGKPLSTFHEVILHQLSMVGYHRVRYFSLSGYDMIVGGIAWAVSILVPEPNGHPWKFRESLPDDKKKTASEKRSEIAQIIYALQKINCPFDATEQEFLNVDSSVLVDIITWVLQRISRQTMDMDRFKCFMACFNMKYEDEAAAALDFISSLRRPNANQYTESARIKLFDNAILRDMKADSRIIIAEYLQYGQTGVKKYPSFVPSDEEGRHKTGLSEISEAQYEKQRQDLKKLSNKIYSASSDTTKQFADKLFSAIDNLHLAENIIELEQRFKEEAALYYAMYARFSELEAQLSAATKYTSFLTSFEVERITDVVATTISRASMFHTDFSQELELAVEVEKTLAANKDQNGAFKKYCPFRREKLENHRKERLILQKKAQIAQSIEQAVRKAFEEYIEVRQKREQGSMADNIDDDPFSMLNEIDHTIASDINEILSTVNKMIGHVNSMPQPKERTEYDYRVAYIGYTSDACMFLSDWLGKAKFLKDQRRNLCERNLRLSFDTKKMCHLVKCASRENAKYHALSDLLFQKRKYMSTWEQDLFKKAGAGNNSSELPKSWELDYAAFKK